MGSSSVVRACATRHRDCPAVNACAVGCTAAGRETAQLRCRLRVASVGLMLHGRRRCPAARDAGAQLILGLAVAPVLRLCHMSNKLVSLTTSSGRKGPAYWLYGAAWRLAHTRCARYGRACRTAMYRLIFAREWSGAETCRCLTTIESCTQATKPNGASNGATSTQVVL